MNEFLPTFFYLVLLTFINSFTLPFILFIGLFMGMIVYPFNFLHLLLLIILFILNVYWQHKKTLKWYLLKNLINTLSYILTLMIIYQNFNYNVLISNLIWNSLFTILIFKQGKFIYAKK